MGFWSQANEARSAEISARVESRAKRAEKRAEAVSRANAKRIKNGHRTPLRSSTFVTHRNAASKSHWW